jgi:hypothetical protein
MDDRPSHISGYEVDEPRHGGGEAIDSEPRIQEDGGDIGACEEVVQVIVRAFLFPDPGLELRVHGDELFVERLEFLPGESLGFLVQVLLLEDDREKVFPYFRDAG